MSTAGPSSSRKLVESDSYKESLSRCLALPGVDIAAADEVLAAIGWSLRRNPFAWPKFPSTERLYAAKTHRRTTKLGYVPQLRILFTVEPNGDVTLLQADTMDVFL
jgi:hypothetical protein